MIEYQDMKEDLEKKKKNVEKLKEDLIESE